MEHLSGIPLSPGYAEGPAWVLLPTLAASIPHRGIETQHVADELERLGRATAQSSRQLERIKKKLAARLNGAELGIVDTHLAMLHDPVFVDNVRRRIHHDLVNVERAVAEEVEAMVAVLQNLESEYLKERTSDVRDVGKRLLNNLRAASDEGEAAAPRIPEQTILVAEELLPSHTLELDRDRIVGVVAETGGASSHATILARALEIPFVAGIPNVVQRIRQGSLLLVDGTAGRVVVNPRPAVTRSFTVERLCYEAYRDSLRAEECEPCATTDGTDVELWGNIGNVAEAPSISDHRLKGVGLFRTEFLFLDVPAAPNLCKHLRAYQEILAALPNYVVTFRTLDLGGDKLPAFVPIDGRPPPRHSVRGLRFALAHPAMLRTQLRGVLRLADNRRARILFPMVVGADDMERALAHLHWAADREGVSTLPAVGAMIETPSAIFELDSILALVDFVSVGTNDLTQYVLAVDRQETDVEGYYSVLYPGMLRALQTIFDRTAEFGVEVSVCGEAAGDPGVARLLVGMGCRKLSMTPARAAAVRHAIRGATLNDLTTLAHYALACNNVDEVRRRVLYREKPRPHHRAALRPLSPSLAVRSTGNGS